LSKSDEFAASDVSRFLTTFILMFILWIMLTWNFDWQEILVGAVFSAIVSAITYKRFTRVGLKSLHPKKTLYLLFVYLPFFIKEMIKANLDVAYRALHPKMPVKPGIVETKVGLKSDLGKMFVANSITMTPGTIAMDQRGDRIYVHWIYVRDPTVEGATKMIPWVFEKKLRKVFE